MHSQSLTTACNVEIKENTVFFSPRFVEDHGAHIRPADKHLIASKVPLLFGVILLLCILNISGFLDL